MYHQLKIRLENDTLIMRGSPEESAGCVLRGYVVLHIKEVSRVKSITMSFLGKMKIHWNDKNHLHKKETVVLENHWTFLTQQKKLHVLSPNVYKYPFEYILSGDLAESIDVNSYGSLSYKLKAIVDRPAFSANLIDRHEVRIIRQSMPPYELSSIPMQISNEWANKVDYRITVPKRIYRRGEQIDIEFSLLPKPDSCLHVRHLSCFLKEYTSFVLGGTSNIHTDSRIIRFFRDESFPSIGSHWHKTETISVPHSFDSIQCDTDNQYFKIGHKLKFTMSLINKEGEIAELRASMPINIVNQRLELEEQENELPTYENAWRSVLYSPLPNLDHATSPYSPMTEEPYPVTPSSNSANQTPEDYFAYQPARPNNNCSSNMFGILPSYHSISIGSFDGIENNDGLPSYE